MNKKRAFEISYSWDDFIDSGKLNVNQKMYAQKLFEQVESLRFVRVFSRSSTMLFIPRKN